MFRTFIIAEAGVNHNGSLDMAKELIYRAVEAGADAVKFQTFKAEHIISRHAQKADYQKKRTDKEETQLEMVKKLELSREMHEELVHCCRNNNIKFLSTPFDVESVDLLAHDIQVDQLKIPSGEITNAPLLLKIARSNLPVFLSTGMSNLGEIEQALAVLSYGYVADKQAPSLSRFMEVYSSEEGQQVLREKVTLLHCTTEYPAPFEDVNLRAMDTLASAFGLRVGFSDHTRGISVPIAAVARGAKVIEKHFTLDRSLPGPDHMASLEPDELKQMIDSIRQVEMALGKPMKLATPVEQKNKSVARKSLVAAKTIKKGDKFTTENVTSKRPGTGISPMLYWECIGKVADRDYEEDDAIQL
ncbi:N-acetylneuraminate synthase [Brevibacillus sp. MER 51]|uniref:N-acetylneuraminate synthase n=1 Tax=Brevibacillus sp. MER 51 TaxID=2939560 RepID=UPI002041ADAE|nr:N-acetylneuraminate synthase [Brevibacillus sp. MER 51]MCM3143723.1 N-acetylneuraminate synthase [Brevibacillus sp. MER 51]